MAVQDEATIHSSVVNKQTAMHCRNWIQSIPLIQSDVECEADQQAQLLLCDIIMAAVPSWV